MTKRASRTTASLWRVVLCCGALLGAPVRGRSPEAANCSQVESPAEPGLAVVKEVRRPEYTFHIKPEPGFRALVLRMKVDNLWSAGGPYATDEKVVFSGPEVEGAGDGWREVRVQYYRHGEWPGGDRHGLNVSVGRLWHSVKSSRWWRTHSFEGFVLLVEGPAKLRFECSSADLGQPTPVRLMREPLVLGCVLGGLLLLVAAVWVAFTMIRPAPPPPTPPPDNPPPIPPFPESLLLKRGRKDEPDATYEEFNEATLLRLRQVLDPDTFASCSSVNTGDTPTSLYEAAGDDGTNTSDEAVGKFSLLEEKQRAWQENPNGPAPEPHYVEMHGIINGHSEFAQ